MSTIANAQRAMGYLRANQRPSCSNCAYGVDDAKHGYPSWRCELAGFLSSAQATCKLHKDRPQ